MTASLLHPISFVLICLFCLDIYFFFLDFQNIADEDRAVTKETGRTQQAKDMRSYYIYKLKLGTCALCERKKERKVKEEGFSERERIQRRKMKQGKQKLQSISSFHLSIPPPLFLIMIIIPIKTHPTILR